MKRVAVITALAAVTVSGCVADVPAPVTRAPDLEYAAALLEPQAQRIVTETFAELAEADDARDIELLGERIGGVVTTIREAEYTKAEADDGPAPTTIPDQMQAIYVSGATGWPRTLVTVTEQANDDVTPVVVLWVQDSIGEPYQVQAWAHMIPGATLPAMPGTTTGAEQLDLTSTATDPTPQDALDSYLELLREGSGSDLDEQFAPDSYRERLFAARDTLSEAAEDADGDYVDTIQSRTSATYVMSTADGGALMFAPVEVASSFRVQDATVSIAEGDEPLLDGDLDDRVTHEYLDVIVLYIPGPESDDLPVVVAADHNLIRVTDS